MVESRGIAVVKQSTDYLEKQDFFGYLTKLARTINESQADIIVGPELALSSSVEMLSLSCLNKEIQDFSKRFKGRLILPGTGLVYEENTKAMYNLAPVIFRDGSTRFVKKNSSHMEDLIAESKGLEYGRGDIREMVLSNKKKDGRFAIEICRDHGLGKLKNISSSDLDFHFILANNSGGISPEKLLIKDGGIVVLAEGGKIANSGAYVKKGADLFPLNRREKGEYILFN